MERNPQQQKQGAARFLAIFAFMIPDPYSPSTAYELLFTDHWSLIPVKAHCSLLNATHPLCCYWAFFRVAFSRKTLGINQISFLSVD